MVDAAGMYLGRTSNVWESPKGCLMFSFTLEMDNGHMLPFLQYVVSIALVDAIEQVSLQKVKWIDIFTFVQYCCIILLDAMFTYDLHEILPVLSRLSWQRSQLQRYCFICYFGLRSRIALCLNEQLVKELSSWVWQSGSIRRSFICVVGLGCGVYWVLFYVYWQFICLKHIVKSAYLECIIFLSKHPKCPVFIFEVYGIYRFVRYLSLLHKHFCINC